MRLIFDSSTVSGGFSDVFFDHNEMCVYKLFISYKHDPLNPGRGPIEDELRREEFKSEIAAYERIFKSDQLRKFIPEFGGKVKVSEVVDQNGKVISERYLLDCCYKLEIVAGKHLKFQHAPQEFKWIEEKFHDVGVMYTEDMSCFIIDNEPRIKLIDFGIRPAYHEEELKKIMNGEL
jgi:hypothetical protein